MALGGVRPHRTRGVFTPHGICGLAGITRVGEGLGSETRCCPFHWLAPILANPDELVAIYACMAGADRIGVGWSPSPQTYHHGCLHGLRLFVHLIHDGFCGCAAFGVAFIIALIVVGLACSSWMAPISHLIAISPVMRSV